jgi:hypothetical protein
MSTIMRAPVVRCGLERVDRHRGVTWMAVAGAGVGAAMALWGLPPVDLHGPLHYVGVMDPLCGGTRSVRYAFAGRWGEAWRYNPLGPFLVVGAVLVAARTALGVATGRWPTVTLAPRWWVWAPAAVLVVALEVNQQVHSALLRAHPPHMLPAFTGAVVNVALGFAVFGWIPWRHRRGRQAVDLSREGHARGLIVRDDDR